MNKAFYGKVCRYSVFCMAMILMMLQFPQVSLGDEYILRVDVSPNIINIASERNGEIRIWTGMSYSSYMAGDPHEAFVYFNDGQDSVENIRATRDSWGNLILKFNLEDLLNLPEGYLILEGDNAVKVVLVISDDDHIGYGSVYIVGKKASDKESAK